ncbi:hypothetical protein GXN76_00990 [Kroppenstedtia pulmonis]|uniref:Uncharacterized protein n=1 Tax=Kroppenstedtia pulmonis TaxID=1380685 RepID=A0A7D4BG06_9BACL|nr:hypothetical protein [Kroppenstedtia pulmonis]QKG83175.1 hypothetical protein GXN76_00990 [Kroppenstedtia pulmonis]
MAPPISNFWIAVAIGTLILLFCWAVLWRFMGLFEGKLTNRSLYISFIGNIGSLFGGVFSWRMAGEPVWFGLLLMTLFAGVIFISYRHRRKVHFWFWTLGGKEDQSDSSSLKYFGWLLLVCLLVSVGVTKSLIVLTILSCSFILSACFSSTIFYQMENPDWRGERGL